jgi:large subunit ribosomal protein L18
MSKLSSSEQRKFRQTRVRKTIQGTSDRPRLNVFRSSKHINAQLIDDLAGKTLVAVSSLHKEVREKKQPKKSRARHVGVLMARLAKEKGISQVVFDRGGYLYHGRIKELAEGAREGGLKF